MQSFLKWYSDSLDYGRAATVIVKSFAKYSLIFFLLVLLTGGVTLAVVNHKPTLLKPVIEHWFKANYQRTLKLDGEIRLAFFPHVDLSLHDVSLSEYQRDDLFALIEHLNLTIQEWPLLGNRLLVDHFHVTGMTAKLVRDLDGVLNIADLLKSDDKSFIDAFQINRFETKNSRVSFQDESVQRFYDFDGIQLTGSQIDMNSVQQIQMQSRVSVSEMLEAKSNAIVSQMIAQLNGEAIVFEKGGSTAGTVFLTLQSSHESHDDLEADFAWHFSTRLSIANLSQTNDRLNSRHIHMELMMQQSEKIAQASLDTALVFNMDEMFGTLSDIHLAVDFFHPDYTRKSIHGNFNGQVNLDWYAELLSMDMRGKINDDVVNATGQLQGFKQQHHTFNLEIDAIDLTAFLPAETSDSDTEANVFPDFSVLNKTNLKGSIQIGQLVVNDTQFSGMQLIVGSENHASPAAPLE